MSLKKLNKKLKGAMLKSLLDLIQSNSNSDLSIIINFSLIAFSAICRLNVTDRRKCGDYSINDQQIEGHTDGQGDGNWRTDISYRDEGTDQRQKKTGQDEYEKKQASSYALVKDRAIIIPSPNCLFWRFLVVFSHCFQTYIWTDTQRDPPMKIQGQI